LITGISRNLSYILSNTKYVIFNFELKNKDSFYLVLRMVVDLRVVFFFFWTECTNCVIHFDYVPPPFFPVATDRTAMTFTVFPFPFYFLFDPWK
jgi:hypothetical protein